MNKIKISISILWIIFTLLFFFLGLRHWNISKESIPQFKISKRPLAHSGSVKILGADVDQPIKDFANNFNSYLDEQNKTSKNQNRSSAFGYWLASLTAVASLIFEWTKR